MHPTGRTSSDRLGRGASSGFLAIFCFRLSRLAGREDLSASPCLAAWRLAVGVLPRSGFEPELEAMAADGCCGEEAVMDDDECECLGRAGGVDPRTSMAGSERFHGQLRLERRQRGRRSYGIWDPAREAAT